MVVHSISEEAMWVRIDAAQRELSDALRLALTAKGSTHPTSRALQHAYALTQDAKLFAGIEGS